MGDARSIETFVLADERPATVYRVDGRHRPTGRSPQRRWYIGKPGTALSITLRQDAPTVLAAEIARIVEPAAPLGETASTMVVSLNAKTRLRSIGVGRTAIVLVARGACGWAKIGKYEQQHGREAGGQEAPVFHNCDPENHGEGCRAEDSPAVPEFRS